MSKASTVKTSPEVAEDAPLRKADIAAGKLVLRRRGAAGAVLPNKQRVNIFLDGAVVEHFKAKAGDRGYQTLINEALKQAIQAESLEGVVRKTIREELRRA
ncbi:MAG: BrnA antitoxin family protein [Burkholderiales bacterium]|nr:BrnA antitoxin family protein [Burkholderiales bacterium]